MEQLVIDETGEHPTATGVERRKLAGELGTTHVSINHYALESGERFSESLHAHVDQEEVFVILDGEATFEHRPSGEQPDEPNEITVSAGECVRFAPGEFQSGWNATDARVAALGIGAPRDTEDVRIARIPGFGEVACPDCGRADLRPATSTALVCPDCDAKLSID